MMKKMKLHSSCNAFLLIMCMVITSVQAAYADSIVSPFNGKSVPLSIAGNYEFIIAGHLHGASTNGSGFPASSLLANIDTLNKLEPVLMVSLGDIFLEVSERNIANYERSFFRRISYPLFNTVGNHDIDKLYDASFGKRYYSFTLNSEMFILLDTEVDDGSITGEQYGFLEKQLQAAGTDTAIKNIFIFSHRPVWAEGSPRFKSFFSDNTRSSFGNNFESEVKPLMIGLARVKNVYWFSGSMGDAPASFFYAKEPDVNLVYMQTAIRDLPRDAVLRVRVNNGSVFFSGFSFNGSMLKNISEYNEDYWKSNAPAEKEFNFRLLPLYTKQLLTHWYFWSGFAAALLMAFAFWRYRAGRIKNKRKNA